MRARLTVALVAIAIGLVAIFASRFLGPSGTVPTAVSSVEASATPVAPPSPTVAESAGPIAAATPSAEPTATPMPTPSPAPTVTTDPNLLSMSNGAFVRRWTIGGFKDPVEGAAQGTGASLTPGSAGPVELVFELPSVAHIDAIGVGARSAKPADVVVAVGTDGQAFRRVGSIAIAPGNEQEHRVAVAASARFVRFEVHHQRASAVRLVTIAGYGTAGPPQHRALSGTWASADLIEAPGDAVFFGVSGRIPDAPSAVMVTNPRVTTEQEGVLSEFECAVRNEPWRGPVSDGVARFAADRLQIAGNGNLLIGHVNGRWVMALRSKVAGACAPSSSGSGPTVVAFVRVVGEPAAELDPLVFPGYRFERRMVPLLEASQLQHAQFAILDGDCNATHDLTPRQQRTLLSWVAAGHKLIIRDADVCSSSDYSFLPYHFASDATGAHGARGELLSIADPSTLGSGPSDPAHELDTAAYVKSKNQQIGDSDIVQTDDPHWCGHLFSANAIGANGWVHAYTRYGRGLIIYDGFDRDDVSNGVAAARRLVQLEYAQPAQSELPCNARVASALALYPSADKTLPPGKPTTLRVPMMLSYAAKRSNAQDVALAIAGDTRYPATVAPSHIRVASGVTARLIATIQLTSGWSGVHAYTVTASGDAGQSAQATIRIDGTVALARAFESQRRVRIYGIHFDVDSARIQPLSEATIAQIAQVLAQHRDWKMRVEGHTDSDGGAEYNEGLSVRRARAVVADLVTRYHVPASQLTSAGFGLTKPVASNATEAGKALNRRVELVRL